MTVPLIVVATLIVLFLPGTAWQVLTRPRGLDPLEKMIEAASASLALTGLAALYLFLAGIQLSAAGVIGLYLAVLGVGAAVVARQGFRFRLTSGFLLTTAAVLALIAWRLYQARDLVLPAWVDPVHHVLLVRRMVEYGGLPPDWQPYLPAPLYYHYGFHILAAAFTFWSGLSVDRAVLVFGQVINAMTAFSVYRLAKAAWGSTLRAGLAGLLTAFAFHMPAYYLTWGRYPLLAGILVLPLAMAAALEVRRDPSDRAAWARLALYSAAVCFCHFLTVGLLGLFFLALLGAECWHALRKHSWKGLRWQPFAGAALGALAAAPWLWRVWSYTHQWFSIDIPDAYSSAANAEGLWQYLIYLTGPLRSHIILGLAGLGMVYGLAQGWARLLAAWGLMLAFLATPYGLRFDPFRPDHLAIILFLPGSLLLANLLASASERLSRIDRGVILRILAAGLPLLVGIGLSLWGIWETRSITNPVTILANNADMVAIRWVQDNTQANDRFFINSTPWMGNVYRGTDGGYWLLTLTGRFAVVPPLAAGWSSPQDAQQFMEWAKRASEVNACDELFWSLVQDAQLTYAYLRLGAGSLQPSSLDHCEGVTEVYSQGGVNIYRLSPQ